MREVFLANGKGVALVDDEDYELVNQYRWCFSYGYAKGANGGPFMHRLIMGAPPFERAKVDHINGDKLDNRRSNLRWATDRQNQGNRKKRSDNCGYKGVSWHPQNRKWMARIGKDGRVRHIGYFDTAEEAALAYDEEAKREFGVYARLNFN